MNWYKLRYTLDVNDDGKPETVVLRANSEKEARLRVTEHFIKKCRGVFGEPTILSVEPFESWDAVKQSVHAGGVHDENN